MTKGCFQRFGLASKDVCIPSLADQRLNIRLIRMNALTHSKSESDKLTLLRDPGCPPFPPQDSPPLPLRQPRPSLLLALARREIRLRSGSLFRA
jgi:hypothetical protein